jgi:hypothetical protein
MLFKKFQIYLEIAKFQYGVRTGTIHTVVPIPNFMHIVKSYSYYESLHTKLPN